MEFGVLEIGLGPVQGREWVQDPDWVWDLAGHEKIDQLGVVKDYAVHPRLDYR